MALWRNGRRAGLRNQFLREYRFKSDKGYNRESSHKGGVDRSGIEDSGMA